jgi:hypothetical protein
MKASLFQWLGMRRIYLIKMYFDFEDDNTFSSSIQNNNVDQSRYTQHIVMRGAIRDDMMVFIISHCRLLSINISRKDDNVFSPYPQITDNTLQSIAEYCTGLQSLSLSDCKEITDTGLITISEHNNNDTAATANVHESIVDMDNIKKMKNGDDEHLNYSNRNNIKNTNSKNKRD